MFDLLPLKIIVRLTDQSCYAASTVTWYSNFKSRILPTQHVPKHVTEHVTRDTQQPHASCSTRGIKMHPKALRDVFLNMKQQGYSMDKISRALKVSRATLFRWQRAPQVLYKLIDIWQKAVSSVQIPLLPPDTWLSSKIAEHWCRSRCWPERKLLPGFCHQSSSACLLCPNRPSSNLSLLLLPHLLLAFASWHDLDFRLSWGKAEEKLRKSLSS